MFSRILRLTALLSLSALLSHTAPVAAQPADTAPLPIIATIPVIADFVAEVGGDNVKVTSLVGAEADVHDFEPTPQTVRSLKSARLIVANGLGLESWLPRLLDAGHYQGAVVEATSGLTPLTLEEDGTLQADPHAWHDVSNARHYVTTIRDALKAADPAHAASYDANAAAYDAKLVDLDRWVKSRFDAIPKDRRAAITTHDAFQYFAKAYGLTLLAPLGLSSDEQPSAKNLKALIRQIRQNHITALFFEHQIDPRLMRQIAEETGTKVGPELYGDGLSAAGGEAATYLQMIRLNADRLATAMKVNP
jgi:zinc/manganese transport system substrate-binding protein